MKNLNLIFNFIFNKDLKEVIYQEEYEIIYNNKK